MNFGSLDKLKEAGGDLKNKALTAAAQQAAEAMKQANQLLALLQDSGYKVGELNVDLSMTPTITIDLKTSELVSDTKLDGIYQANKDNDVLSMILLTLIQANKLRDMVKLDSIELTGAKLVLKSPPSVSLHWKEKAAASAAGAAA